MNTRERHFLAAVLTVIVFMVGADLLTDSTQGVQWWHLGAEGAIALAALIGLFFVMRSSFALRHSLEVEKQTSSQLKAEAEKWRSQSRKYLDGLSQAIDAQLTAWRLTHSEKEIAFLLLKGFSSKEIADLRKTNEKTVRTQATSIYSKAGLNGRSGLSAFFLEDLFLPSQAQLD
ncbi:MAG: response regulator transcription factor [Bdellovibrionales bacterium]|nr:response regulator transcription factor [Bdellovibrionales bacterium]